MSRATHETCSSARGDPVVEVLGVELVQARIRQLGQALNFDLSAAESHASERADRKALAVGVAMSCEICDCWQGRLGSYIRTVEGIERTAAGAGEHPRTTEKLQRDYALVRTVRMAIARSADGDGWASIPAVGSAIRDIEPEFSSVAY